MCPLRGQSLESRLAAQRSVLRAEGPWRRTHKNVCEPRGFVYRMKFEARSLRRSNSSPSKGAGVTYLRIVAGFWRPSAVARLAPNGSMTSQRLGRAMQSGGRSSDHQQGGACPCSLSVGTAVAIPLESLTPER